MKIYIILIGLFLVQSTVLSAQKKGNSRILSLSVDLYMNTSAQVSCENFATVFEKILIVREVTQSDSVAMFSGFTRNIKYAKYNRGIDVRSKFLYETDDTNVVTVCTNGRDIIVDGKLAKRNKKFIKFLNSMTK